MFTEKMMNMRLNMMLIILMDYAYVRHYKVWGSKFFTSLDDYRIQKIIGIK